MAGKSITKLVFASSLIYVKVSSKIVAMLIGNEPCIYQIRNKVDGKLYIGLTTVGVNSRWRSHLSAWKQGKNSRLLQKAYNDFGNNPKSFEVSTLEVVLDSQELPKREIFWIAKKQSYDPDIGYNISRGGQFTEHTEESKQLMSRLSLERYANGYVNPLKGKKFDVERTKLAASASVRFWEVQFEDNASFTVSNMRSFSDTNGLDFADMCAVASGKLKCHRGYVCKKLAKDS